MQLKPADINLEVDSLEIEAIELITNADLEITIVADDAATNVDESVYLDDFNSLNSRMFSATMNPMISFVNENAQSVASPLAANAYLFDAQGEEYLGSILINNALYEASITGDVLKLEIGENKPARNIVLKQGDDISQEFTIPEEFSSSVVLVHQSFNLSNPIDVYVKTLETDNDSENLAVNYSVVLDMVLVLEMQ